MDELAPELAPCRTCGRPRGENIAGGTRCERCGQQHAAVLWIAGAVTAAISAFAVRGSVVDAAMTALAAFVALPPAFVGAVLLHELCHAVAARLLGQTVSRVLVGEGRAVLRLGRESELVVGSVVLGNGLTNVMDLRRVRYRGRWVTMLMVAPIGSLVAGVATWSVGADWPLPWRAAALAFAFSNIAMAVVTLIPVPTFGARVWSDLALALYLWRSGDAEVLDQMLLNARERIAILLERGDPDAAIATGRAAVAAVPEAPLARSLLAFTLVQAGHTTQALALARETLGGEIDAESREYLTRLAESVEKGAPLSR